MAKKVSWFLGPGLALLVACSPQQGVSSRSPLSADAVGTVAAASGSDVVSAVSCTLTQGFWLTHPEAWPIDPITIGGVTYTKEEALAILSTPTRGDATYILANQLIAAKLNVAIGADDSAIATTIADADNWLAGHPLGSAPKSPDRDLGIALAELLDQYNNGLIGPGHCTGAPPSPSPTPPPE